MLFLIEIKKKLYDNVISGKLSPERSSVMKKLSLLFTLALATVTVAGCDAFSFINGGTTPEPEGGEVTPSDPGEGKKEDDPEEILIEDILLESYSETLEIGDTYQIDYEVWPRGAYNEVSFDSSNTSVATVSVNGLVEAKAEGNSVITLTSIQDTSVTAELSITVNPAPISNYTVAFNANDGTGTMANDTTTGSTYITPSCTFERTNYTFDGWALNSPTATPKYGVGATISNISANITLYATWRENSQPIVNYNVAFNSNGGSGTMSAQTTSGSTYVTPSCAFTYAGHSFVKWALNSPSGTQYAAGSTIYGITSNITLYAVWEEIVVNYTVSFNANGGTGTMASKTTSGSTYVTPACIFTYTGYSFSKWALNSKTGTQYAAGETISGIASNITLYAIWTEDSSGDYYSSITATSGITLLGQLHDLSVTKHTHYNSYSGEINTTNLMKTDPYQDTSYVMDFYSGAPTKNQVVSSGDTGWNREHVWCQSLSNGLYGTSGAGADIQHIRPTIPKLNSDRGNKLYGELNNSGTASTSKDAYGNTVQGGYYSGNVFQPMDNKKGDCARIVMYLYMHYNKYSRVGGTKDGSASTGTLDFDFVVEANSESAAIQLLLTWNAADPVDDIERTRNEEAAKITGCRNPFIDHPEYPNMIWGN